VNTKLNNFSNAFARLKEGVAKYDGTDMSPYPRKVCPGTWGVIEAN